MNPIYHNITGIMARRDSLNTLMMLCLTNSLRSFLLQKMFIDGLSHGIYTCGLLMLSDV